MVECEAFRNLLITQRSAEHLNDNGQLVLKNMKNLLAFC